MPEPEKIGKVGTVEIAYRSGHSGPMKVTGMPEWDFGRLQNLVNAYEGHDQAVDKLNAHPNEQVRKEARRLFGLPQPLPRQHMEVREFDFPFYTVIGAFKRQRAVNRRVVKLTPKHIQAVKFTHVVAVTN
jgi:hypothetical protein